MSITHRLRVYAPNGPSRGLLTHPETWKYSTPFCDIAGAELSQADSKPAAALLQQVCEVAFETSYDQGVTWVEEPNSRFLRLQRKKGDEPTGIRSYTMPGYAFVLSKARMNWYDDLNDDGKYMYNKATAGGILIDILTDNFALDWAPKDGGLTYKFTGTKDSAGKAWTQKLTIGYEPGLDLLTIINNLADQGIVDWDFVGRELRVFNADTVLAGKKNVLLRPGVDLDKVAIDGDLTDLVHVVSVYGANESLATFSRTDDQAPAYWGRWRGSVSQGGTDDADTLAVVGRANLDENGREKIQYAADLKLDRSRYTPHQDFAPGHSITGVFDLAEGKQEYRCRGINYSRASDGKLTCTLIVNDRFVERSIRAARRTNGIANGTSAANATAGTVNKPKGKKITPLKGSLGTATSDAYINASGYARAYLSIGFAEITRGTRPKGKGVETVDMDVRRYWFRGNLNDGTGRFEDWGSTTQDATQPYVKNGLNPGTSYVVQYCAVSEDGLWGPWSDSKAYTTAVEDTPPPKPSKPTTSSRLGTLTVAWDGLAASGAAMPKDFARVDVWALQGGASRVIGVIINGKAPIVVSGVTTGEVYEVWLRPYDRSGNVGPDSDHADPQTVLGVMDDLETALEINQAVSVGAGAKNKNTYSASDPPTSFPDPSTAPNTGDLWFKMSNGLVVGQWIWSGTFWQTQQVTSAVIANLDAGKITTGTLAAARIAALSITADKIAAGAIDATKITATAIDGKTINGAVINGGTITGSAFQTAVPGAGNRTVIGFDGRFYAYGYDQTSDQTKMMWDFKPYARGDSNPRSWGYARFYIPVWASSVIAYQVGNKDGSLRFGEELELTGDSSTYGLARLTLTADDSGGRVYSSQIYDRTYGSSSNVYITGAGTIGRSTSASKYKLNVEPLSETFAPADSVGEAAQRALQTRDVLGLQPVSWYDKATLEAYASTLHRQAKGRESAVEHDVRHIEPIPGLLAEDVLEKLGPEFVEFGDDGEVEGILYDRAWIPLIPVLRDILARVQHLEESCVVAES